MVVLGMKFNLKYSLLFFQRKEESNYIPKQSKSLFQTIRLHFCVLDCLFVHHFSAFHHIISSRSLINALLQLTITSKSIIKLLLPRRKIDLKFSINIVVNGAWSGIDRYL